MNKSLFLFVSILVLAGIAFGVFRFFEGRAEKRSFEVHDDVSVSESPAGLIMEGEDAGDIETVEESNPVELADEPEETVVASTGANPTLAEPEPEPKPETQPVLAPSIADRLVSFGYEDRSSRSIDTVIIHSSYDALGDEPYSVSGIIEVYRQYGVAAHYLIDRKGKIYRLVEDRDVAYHAGVSKMPDGRTGVNAFSIGIELLNTLEDEYTDAQYGSLNKLLAYLEGRYGIEYVLGHDEVAPSRKTDPWNFDWDEIR